MANVNGWATLVVLAALLSSEQVHALTVDQLNQGVAQALASGVHDTTLGTYVTGYVHGAAEFGRTLGLVCDEANLRSIEDELRAVQKYVRDHSDEWGDGAQLLVNRALLSPHCKH